MSRPRVWSIRLVACSVVVLGAAVGHAQEGASTTPSLPPVENRNELPIQTPGDVENAARALSTAGRVEAVDVPHGVLVLRTGAGAMRFRAKPNRIREVRVGERFTADYAIYGEQPWLVEDRNPGVGLGEFGQPRSVSGWVRSFDRENGTVTIYNREGQRTYSLHPAETEGLLPTLQVELLYVPVQGVDWVASVQRKGHESEGPRGR